MVDKPDERVRGTRIGQAERDTSTQSLVLACSEGRLTLAEFEERVEAVLAATTRVELVRATRDVTPAPTAPLRDRRWSVALVGGLRRKGPSRLPRHLIHVSMIGNTSIDLGDAELSSDKTTITLVSLIGKANVRVPRAVRSELSGFSVIGGRHISAPRPELPGGPLVHLRTFSLIGGTTVRPSGSRWRRFALAR